MSSSTDQFPDSAKSVSKSKSESQPTAEDLSSTSAANDSTPAAASASDAAQVPKPPKRPVEATPPQSAAVPSAVTAAPTDAAPTAAMSDSGDAEADVLEDEAAKTRRQQPIPPPSEPKQYRAIGLVLGRYEASEEQFNRGLIRTDDGIEIEAVLLGRVTSLVKKHLDPEVNHLWVVYPRTREKEENLHLQIVGVWEPENLHQGMDEPDPDAQLHAPQPRKDYFSIRGEVISYEPEDRALTVKILQMPRRKKDSIKAFRLNLRGDLPGPRTIGHFWDLHVQREGSELTIQRAQRIAMMMPRKSRKKKGGFRRKPSGPPRRTGDRSMAPNGGGSGRSLPKPVSRQERSARSKIGQEDG